ncbi:MAG: hypothetical protein AAGK02_15800 [Pseudomonadota bacterium]
MLTSIRGLTAATFSAGLLLSAAPAFANEVEAEAETETLALEEIESIDLEAIAVTSSLIDRVSFDRLLRTFNLGVRNRFEIDGLDLF